MKQAAQPSDKEFLNFGASKCRFKNKNLSILTQAALRDDHGMYLKDLK